MVTFMDKSEIAKLAPSVFATEPSDRMSDRYSFVSSHDMIDQFDALGWGVVGVTQPKSYRRDPGHKKHRIEFQSRNDSILVEDPRKPGSMVHPRILVTNSSDGSSSLSMAAGLFALICSNGLVVQSLDLGSFRERHMGLTMESVSDAILNMNTLVPAISESIDQMSRTKLDHDGAMSLAMAGKAARWGASSDIDPSLLLTAHRQEDLSNDLWTVFNRVQENTLRGGFKGDGQKRVSRPLSNIDATQRVNLALWETAEQMLAAA